MAQINYGLPSSLRYGATRWRAEGETLKSQMEDLFGLRPPSWALVVEDTAAVDEGHAQWPDGRKITRMGESQFSGI